MSIWQTYGRRSTPGWTVLIRSAMTNCTWWCLSRTVLPVKPVRMLLDSIGAQVDGESFETDITISGTIASSQEEKLSATLTELTGAQALVSFRTIA